MTVQLVRIVHYPGVSRSSLSLFMYLFIDFFFFFWCLPQTYKKPSQNRNLVAFQNQFQYSPRFVPLKILSPFSSPIVVVVIVIVTNL